MVKKLFCPVLFFFLLFSCSEILAQSWMWAKSTGSTSDDAAHAVAMDPMTGDIYVAGYFNSTSIVFGSTTLTNAGAMGSGDVFLAKYSAAGSVIWAKSFGGTQLDRTLCVKTDAAGNLYMAGMFASSSITFGSTTLTHSGSTYDIFVVKLNSAGTVLWARSSGVTANDVGVNAVAVDTFGNVYAAGSFGSSTLTFGSTVLTNGGSFPFNDMFLVKYNSSGTLVWVKKAGSTKDEIANSICTDKTGNIYLTGYSGSPSVTFGSTTLTNTGSSDMFIVKYDSSGAVLWAKNSGSSNAMGQSVSTDTAGNAYVSGMFSSSSITFGSSTFTGAGGNDAFLVKYGPTGTVGWANHVGGTGWESGACVYAGTPGNVYLTGYFFSPSVTIGTSTLTHTAAANMYIARYNTSGGFVSALSGAPYATNGSLGGIGIIADVTASNLYVVGTLGGDSAAIGTTVLRNLGTVSNSDLFVARYGITSTTSLPVTETSVISIYPNPAHTALTIVCDEESLFELTDITGRVVISKQLSGQGIETLNIADISPGLYLYRFIQNGVPKHSGKLVKE